MKKLVITIIALLPACAIIAQNVGINATGNNPDASAGLDINFNNKGMLIPRIALASTTDVSTIGSPATGLLVYNTATGGLSPAGFYYYTGSQWLPLWSGTAVTSVSGTSPVVVANGNTTPTVSLQGGAGTIFYGTGGGAGTLGAGSAGQLLKSGGAAAPEWTSATYPSAAGASGNVLTSNGTNWVSAQAAASKSKRTFVAGEDITAGQAVAISDGLSGQAGNSSTSGSTTYQFMFSTSAYSQKFTTTANAKYIKSIAVKMGRSGGGNNFSSFNVYSVDIYTDNAGVPGTFVGNIGSITLGTNTQTVYNVTTPTPVAVNSSATYHIVISGATTSGWQVIGNNSPGTGTNSGDGSTWAASNGALYYAVTEVWSVAGQPVG